MIDTGVDNAYYSCGGGRGRHRVEQFHLLFLARLARRVPPALFVLKGGCNLRFFHGSIRYSEDIDLDLGPIGVGAFRDKVRDLLSSRPFAQILETRGVAIERVSEPEQTDTTLRWKIGLRAEGTGAPLPTKIECSRRGLEDGVVLGRVDPPVARAHRLGVWALPNRVDPLALPELLTAPFPAYVSLQSTLYLHGMISQVPAVTYAVTLARTRRFLTPLGTVSLHHVQPAFFFGYEDAGRAGGRLATPEKALVDFLYLAPARSGLFRALPEIDWPSSFRTSVARSIARRIEPLSRRKIVARRLDELLDSRLKR